MKLFLVALIFVSSIAPAQVPEKIPVYLGSSCEGNSTGSIVESSFRESVRASSGYRLVDQKEAGVFTVSLACVDAGQPSEGWSAIAYMFGLVMKPTPEGVGGLSIWRPSMGVFTTGAAHAQNKGQELFARFDNELHHH